MKFKLKAPAELTHINTRKKEEKGEEILYVDLKFNAKNIKPDDILPFFDDEHANGSPLKNLLFRDDAIVRNIYLSALNYDIKVRGVSFRVGKIIYAKDAVAGKFSVTGIDGGLVGLGFTLTISPTSNEVAQFAEMLGHSQVISVEASQEEMQLEAA